MKNYQLYKTTPLISGQLKWDIVIGKYGGRIYVKDFHITPISQYIPYNKTDDTIIRYDHRFNIKEFYNKIMGYFYSSPVNPNMSNSWPIVDDDALPIDNTYFAGCDRGEYGIYKKQFEYLCPAWIEQLSDSDDLSFQINISAGENKISTKNLTLEILDGPMYNFHNQFVNYFKNYLNYVGINKGCDEVININLNKKEAYLRGVDVTTGNLVVRSLNISDNILSRERPLMEFDSFLTESFKNTNTISPNLINFNLVFDLDDILSASVTNKLSGQNLIIGVNIGTNNGNIFKSFEKNDIYTNYEYIPRTFCKGMYKFDDMNNVIIPKPKKNSTAPNVLDYLQDDKYIDFVDVNKVVQKICHWQLVGNDDYIFNLYNGFGGYIEQSEGTNFLINHRYSDSPDLIQPIYNEKLNNLNWVNVFEINEAQYVYILSNYNKLINANLVSDLSSGWVHNIKYKNTTPLKVILGYINDPDMDLSSYADGNMSIYYKKCLINLLGSDNNILFICSRDLNSLTFRGLLNIIKPLRYIDDESVGSVELISEPHDAYRFIPATESIFKWNGDILQTSSGSYVIQHTLNLSAKDMSGYVLDALQILIKAMEEVVNPVVIILNGGLTIGPAPSPDVHTKEVEYYKNNNTEYLIRYDGQIKPCFGYGDNFIYYKIYKDSEEFNETNIKKYSDSGYPPLYKSIKYYSFKSEVIDYSEPIKCITVYPEYKWFEQSKVLYLPPEMEFDVESEDSTVESVQQAIITHLKSKFDVDIDGDYVLKLYNIFYDLKSYDKLFNYKINMILK